MASKSSELKCRVCGLSIISLGRGAVRSLCVVHTNKNRDRERKLELLQKSDDDRARAEVAAAAVAGYVLPSEREPELARAGLPALHLACYLGAVGSVEVAAALAGLRGKSPAELAALEAEAREKYPSLCDQDPQGTIALCRGFVAEALVRLLEEVRTIPIGQLPSALRQVQAVLFELQGGTNTPVYGTITISLPDLPGQVSTSTEGPAEDATAPRVH